MPAATPVTAHMTSDSAVTAFGDTRPISSRSIGPITQTRKPAMNGPSSWLCFTAANCGGRPIAYNPQ